jgi:uncharacterized protein YecT (DUF1311 family)
MAGTVMAALAVLGLVPPAAGEESPEATLGRQRARPMIETCLAAAQTVEAMRACKRIVFTPCVQEEENRQSTHGLVMCNSREGVAWDALLEARSAELAKRDAFRAEALAAANAAWTKWVEAECSFHRAEAQGGSAEGVITTECIADLTAERVIGLTLQVRGELPY